MPRAPYYSPRIDRDVISQLYHAAKAERVPMTKLASRLLRAGLSASAAESGVIREEPPHPTSQPHPPNN